MSGLELLSDQGIRLDGRRPSELRKIEYKLSVSSEADGSAFFQQGNTKVLAIVCGPHEVTSRKLKSAQDKAVLNCVIKSAPFSTGVRNKVSRNDKRRQMMARVLKSAFEATVLTDISPGSQIDLCFLVLFADGGLLSACVNAGTLALINAGIPIRDFLCGCSAGFVRQQPLLDVNHMEGLMGGAELNVAIHPTGGQVALYSLDSSARIHLSHVGEIRRMAKRGCLDVKEVMDAAVKQYAATLSTARE